MSVKEKLISTTVLAVLFVAFAVVFISGFSLMMPVLTYGQPSGHSSNACPFGGEVQKGQCVDEPEVTCPQGYEGFSDEEGVLQCAILIAQEEPICPEGSTDIEEGLENHALCIDDVTGEIVLPECTTEGAILRESGASFVCNIYGEFTDERQTFCEEGLAMNEEGQCVSRPGQSGVR